MYKILLVLFITCSFLSCSTKNEARPQTALDTGREFIRASLDGNFKTAESLLLKDTQNIQLFERYKSFYSHLPGDQKQKYKEAEYTINKYTDVNDSVSTITYSNSYMNKPMDIKIIRADNTWKVDFKYTYGPGLSTGEQK
jgi:hypothetical protein